MKQALRTLSPLTHKVADFLGHNAGAATAQPHCPSQEFRKRAWETEKALEHLKRTGTETLIGREFILGIRRLGKFGIEFARVPFAERGHLRSRVVDLLREKAYFPANGELYFDAEAANMVGTYFTADQRGVQVAILHPLEWSKLATGLVPV
jgi:hypothetical protein